MGSHQQDAATSQPLKKYILLNAFDMSTIGHLSPGQWKNPKDKSDTKRDLEYWIELAKLLERGGINALFLADTYGGYDTLWEGSWSDNATIKNAETDEYFDPNLIRTIDHRGKFFSLSSRHICSPSPQRTPFLFQAGTSSAGSQFAATHAEAIFVSSHSPKVLAPKVANIRKLAASLGRDPQSIKFFATFTPIIGATEEEAQAKYEEAKKYASTIGGLVLFSGWTGVDISKIPIDRDITAEDSLEAHKIRSILDAFTTTSPDIPKWTPRVVAEKASIGGLGPVAVGTPAHVADEMVKWITEADLDGFNLAYVTTPGTFEDVVDLLIPELRQRGLYPEAADQTGSLYTDRLTAREKVYGKGQKGLRDDHLGSAYNIERSHTQWAEW
ncbi:hypothetical protein DV737_g2551, partial [Chaetothyriales sp. CBS 132003]